MERCDSMQKKSAPNIIHSESVFSTGNPYYIHKSVINTSFELHRHDFFEIDLMISGNGVSHINGESYSLSKGDMVLLSPADHHNYILEDNTALEFVNIAFPMGLIPPQAVSVIPSNVKVVHLAEKDYECVKNVCDFLVDKYDNNRESSALLMKTSIEWIFIFLSFSIEKQQKASSVWNFSEVLIYINNNFSQEDLNRATVAKIMHMSPTHFSKIFHKMIGLSFQDYLLNTRLNYANGMLKMTNMTISEIAAASGFGSESYFSKVFKKRFGVSPGKIRKSNRA